MERILIINQEKKQGDVIASKLRGAGYDVTIVANEDEALHTLQIPSKDYFSDFVHHPNFDFGPFKLVFTRAQLLKDGIPVPLSYMECKLLMYLILHREEIVSTQDLMRVVWGYGEVISSGTIYTHISWLRKKLKTPQNPRGYISTIRNIGYIFSETNNAFN